MADHTDHPDGRDDAPADLSALDLWRDPQARERLAGRIAAGAALRLEARRRATARRTAPPHLASVVAWRRPALAAAGLIAALALGSLWQTERARRAGPPTATIAFHAATTRHTAVAGARPSGPSSATITAAAVGVPRPLARVVASGGAPRAADVVALLGGYAR